MRDAIRAQPPGIFILDLEELIGTPREHLEFTGWFLIQKKLMQRTDNSTLAITADGVEYLEEHHHARQQKLLTAQNEPTTTAR